jgi:hypothetical protein
MNTKLSLSYGTGLIQTITKKVIPEIGNKTHIDLLKIKVIYLVYGLILTFINVIKYFQNSLSHLTHFLPYLLASDF